MKLLFEILAGEGGEDAKQLVKQQASIYFNYAEKANLSVDILADSHG